MRLLKPKLRAGVLGAICPADDAVALAVARHDAGAVPVLERCESVPLGAGEDRAEALARLVRSRHLDRVRGTTVLDLDQYALLLVEAPDVPPAELRAAMRWRVKDLIDFHIDDAVIDVFDAPSQRAARGGKPMYAVVARASAVRQRVDELVDAGVELAVVDVPELALRNLTALLPEDVGGVACVYLAGTRGLITLTRQATLYLSRRIETGGVPPVPADADAEALPEDVQGWLDAIVIEVQRSLDYYESHFGQPPAAGVVLAPFGGRAHAIPAYLGRQLGIAARFLDVNDLMESEEPVADELQARCLLAVGAALRTEERAL